MSFSQCLLVKGSLKSLVDHSLGMDRHVHYGSRKRTRHCWLNLLENHDISFRGNDFLVCDAEVQHAVSH